MTGSRATRHLGNTTFRRPTKAAPKACHYAEAPSRALEARHMPQGVEQQLAAPLQLAYQDRRRQPCPTHDARYSFDEHAGLD